MEDFENLYNTGRAEVKRGKTLNALTLFEKALAIQPENPKIQSYLGYCIACERGKIKDAINLCEKAVKVDTQCSENYLNLGRVYLRAGLKLRAVQAFRKGLEIDSNHQEITAELQSLGLRKPPLIAFLPRSHFLNKYLGLITSKLGLR